MFDPSNGDLYVPDFLNGVIDKFDPAGKYISQLPGVYSGVTVDPSTGDLYAANYYESSVDVFSPKGTLLNEFEVLSRPTGLAIDPAAGRFMSSTAAVPSKHPGLRICMASPGTSSKSLRAIHPRPSRWTRAPATSMPMKATR